MIKKKLRDSMRRAMRGSRRESLSVTDLGAPSSKAGYFAGLNEHLLRAVPADAKSVLEVGCADGRLGEAVRKRGGVKVYGVELNAEAAARAATRLDRVFRIDATRELPDLAPGSIDVVTFGDVLEHLVDPGDTLRRFATLLAPGGRIVCCIPNVQHHSVLGQLVRGEFQYQDAGLLDRTHLRFFTRASITKLLMDAGFAPRLLDPIEVPMGRRLAWALRPLQMCLGADQPLSRRDLSVYQWIVEGAPLRWNRSAPETPTTFVACVNDDAQFEQNLAASPCLAAGGPHQLIAVRGARSAAEGLQKGRELARNDVVILLHQDVYLPVGWPARFHEQWRRAQELHGPVGVAGVYGSGYAADAPGRTRRAGRVMDRATFLDHAAEFPARVQTIDEIVLAVARDGPLQADESLGWHFYGADLALQAKRAGLAAVALDAPMFHNSLSGYELQKDFHQSRKRFHAKWREDLPVATSCIVVE